MFSGSGLNQAIYVFISYKLRSRPVLFPDLNCVWVFILLISDPDRINPESIPEACKIETFPFRGKPCPGAVFRSTFFSSKRALFCSFRSIKMTTFTQKMRIIDPLPFSLAIKCVFEVTGIENCTTLNNKKKSIAGFTRGTELVYWTGPRISLEYFCWFVNLMVWMFLEAKRHTILGSVAGRHFESRPFGWWPVWRSWTIAVVGRLRALLADDGLLVMVPFWDLAIFLVDGLINILLVDGDLLKTMTTYW